MAGNINARISKNLAISEAKLSLKLSKKKWMGDPDNVIPLKKTKTSSRSAQL